MEKDDRQVFVNKRMEEISGYTQVDLSGSENNFRTIAENANDGIVLIGAQGNFIYANRCFAEASGYNLDELLTFGFEKLADPSEREILWQRLQRRIRGEPVPDRYETKLINKAGQAVPVEVTASKISWRGQPVSLIIVRDITAHKQMEAGLIREQLKLESRVKERTQELVDTNKALSVLARNIDRKWEVVQKETAKMVTAKILPIIEAFQENKAFTTFRAELNVLQAYLKTLTHAPKTDPGIIFSLSGAELRVATMIKNGFTSPEISRLLSVSEDTVKTHRRNIRKKLKISNSKINLTTYLRSKMK